VCTALGCYSQINLRDENKLFLIQFPVYSSHDIYQHTCQKEAVVKCGINQTNVISRRSVYNTSMKASNEITNCVNNVVRTLFKNRSMVFTNSSMKKNRQRLQYTVHTSVLLHGSSKTIVHFRDNAFESLDSQQPTINFNSLYRDSVSDVGHVQQKVIDTV